MNKLLVFVVVLMVYGAWQHFSQTSPGLQANAVHDEVIMYSLTTCGYCKQKRLELHAAGIVFTEYFIDKDVPRRNELNRKLEQAGFSPRRYGTPILDVHGRMLPNNPDLDVITGAMGL